MTDTARRRTKVNHVNQTYHTYVDGNTVRKVRTMPDTRQQKRPEVSQRTKQNRERALQMNMSYVLFLTLAAIVTVAVCVNYLKLQSQYTARQKNVTALESQLSELKMENDSEYNRLVSSVDLQHVKDVAMNQFGMVYASSSQIISYDSAESDYVKQYQDIPER